MLDQKGRYCDRNRVSCQSLTAENLGGRHLYGRREDKIPSRCQRNRQKFLPDTFGESVLAEKKHGNVRSKAQPQFEQLIPPPTQPPQTLERKQCGSGVRTSSSQATPHGNVF